jgi:hypothetical protein
MTTLGDGAVEIKRHFAEFHNLLSFSFFAEQGQADGQVQVGD